MKKLPKTYLRKLTKVLEKQLSGYQTPEQKLIMLSGARLNWIGDIVSDKSIKWAKKRFPIDKLYLTGTNPRWNKIIIDRSKRSPKKLRLLLAKDKKASALFKGLKSNSAAPILIRFDGGKYKVLDGMGRTVAAIIAGEKEINAYVAIPNGKPKPQCEPHVIYDLLRAYQRGTNKNRKDLIAALRFLRKSYSNVPNILMHRFDRGWLPDRELQSIIRASQK